MSDAPVTRPGRDLHARARSIMEGEERRIAFGRPPGEMYDWAKLVLDQAAALAAERARADEAVRLLRLAPHHPNCSYLWSWNVEYPAKCDCWKSAAPTAEQQ